MNIQVTVTKSGTISNQASFPSMEEAQAWVDLHVGMGSFGAPRFSTVSVEVAPAVIDEEGAVVSPAQFEDQQVENPAGYEIEMADLTAQLAQEETNKAAREFLANSDWKILRHLRQQHLGIATTLSSQEFSELEQERQMAADSIV
jgi:hypothetical protein